MTRLLIVAAVLLALVFFAPAIFAQEADEPMEVMYAENGTDAVITFTSTDPEGSGIDWDVTGIDADDFIIDARGMLMFTSPPNYEGPTDRDNNPEIDRNNDDDPANDEEEGYRDKAYEITVRATEMMASGATGRALSTETDVTVMVTDVDEDGSASLNRLQPEVGTQITASFTDPDAAVPNITDDVVTDSVTVELGWQWYVSKVTNPVADADNHWIEATGNGDDTATYTPFGDCVDPKNSPTNTDGRCPYDDQTDPEAEVDEGKYLRAVVMYTDMADPTTDDVRKAIVVSMYPVRAEVSSDKDNVENPENGSPGFSSAGDYKRTVPENIGTGMPVGDPVVAIDPNSDDMLTYELDVDALDVGEIGPDTEENAEPGDAAHDVDYFSIDEATGQISVKKSLDYDNKMDGYTFYVRAIDPSGETAHVKVTVTTTDSNDAPNIRNSMRSVDGVFENRSAPPSELRVWEKAGNSYDGMPGMPLRSVPGSMNVFTADDDDARGQIFWSIKGEDMDDFELTSSSPDPFTGLRGPGEPIGLKFMNDPDFENPTDSNYDSVYKVTIVARDRFTGGLEDERSLTIFVDNVAEDGDASLSEDQPIIGQPVTAKVEDPDNGLAIVTWQWERSETGVGDWMVIPGATTDTFTPREDNKATKETNEDDDGHYLRATATYTDITTVMDDSTTVRVDERTQTDDDDDDTPEAKTPDLQGVAADDEAADDLYRVRVISKNAVRVDPSDAPDVEAPEFSASSYDRRVSENAETGSIVGDAIQAVPELDDDGNPKTSFEYTLEDTVTGDDTYFTIDKASGQIRVGEVAFPDPLPAGVDDVPDDPVTAPAMTDPTLDYEGDNTFTLIVTTEDIANSSRTVTAEVNISLINVNEHPYFDKASHDAVTGAVTYSEHRTNAVVPTLAGVEPDGDSLRWELTGVDAGAFEIVDADDIDDGKDRVQLMFKKSPDFESPADKGLNLNPGTGADTDSAQDLDEDFLDEGEYRPNDNMYQVTVRATEMSAVGGGPASAATLDVTVEIADFSEDESVSLNWLQPEVETPIMATLSDGDARTTGTETWQWYRAKATEPNKNPNTDTDKLEREWEEITGQTEASYTPVDADKDKYLLARAAYNDTPGDIPTPTEQAAVGISAYKVRANVSDIDNNSPDFNQSETTRKIPEDTAVGMPVGDPVDVDRNEDGDVLTYEIVTDNTTGADGNTSVIPSDHPFFKVDKATGQVSVAKKLSAEETDARTYGPGAGEATAGKYQIVVRATDPSGEITNEENRDDIVVKITAEDVDEAPGVTGGMAELSVNEVSSTKKDDDVTKYVGLGYELTPDADTAAVRMIAHNPTLYHRTEEDVLDRASWPAPIAGDDGALFEYSTPDNGIGRRIHFINPPNFEDPQDANRDNVYEVTIRVVDSDDLVGEKSVRVTVMNVEEDGKLTLSPEQPDDGMPVIATITDPDSPAEYGGVTVTNWEWATSVSSTATEFPEDSIVPGASMSEYTGSVGDFLWARVSYRDGKSVMDDPVTALDERNDNPGTLAVTEQRRLRGDINDDLFHNSDEMATSSTVNAVQPDPDPPGDGMTPDTGVVTIARMVYENVPSTGYVGAPIENLIVRNAAGAELANRHMIGGPDGDTFVFAEDEDQGQDGDASTYYDEVLAPPDADPVDKAGQLALAPVTHLNYESAKNTYTIEITDPDADIEVSVYRITITVADVNERPTAPSELKGLPPALNTDPMFAATSTSLSVDENAAAGTVVGMVMATDADRGDQETLMYSLDDGADAGSFAIDSATGEITTTAMLDYEMQDSYMVMVTATDDDEATDMIYVTIMVNDLGLDNAYDMNEDGKISRDEVIMAIDDFLFGDGSVTRDDVIAVIDLFLFG